MTPAIVAVCFYCFWLGYLTARILNHRRRPVESGCGPNPPVSHWPKGRDNPC